MTPQEEGALPGTMHVDIQMRFTRKALQWMDGQVPRSVEIVRPLTRSSTDALQMLSARLGASFNRTGAARVGATGHEAGGRSDDDQ
jgi:hypothetical protein